MQVKESGSFHCCFGRNAFLCREVKGGIFVFKPSEVFLSNLFFSFYKKVLHFFFLTMAFNITK